MKSYTERRDLYGTLTNDTSTANLALGDILINSTDRSVINMRAWDFTQKQHTDTTVASQEEYKLPVDYRRLIGQPTVTIGSTKYTPIQAPDRMTYDLLTQTTFTSDIPQYFFIFDNRLLIYPTPASAGNTIGVPYEKQQKDLNIADYTTGSIVSIANGATAVTGTGTTWTAAMVGRFIRITGDDSTTTGDHQWYKIAAVPTATTLTLDIPYAGASISSATQPYTIGQMPILPDGYHSMSVYKAAEQYFLQNPDLGDADRYRRLYEDKLDELKMDHSMKTSNVAVSTEQDIQKNPNLFVRQ